MAVCDGCGFDGHVDGTPCGVCGNGEEGGEQTLVRDDSAARTIADVRTEEQRAASRPTLFRNRYAIGQTLGQGGMGTVFRALDTSSDRNVALKIMHEPTRVEDASFGRFQREVRILRRLDHPLIPRITDAGLDQNRMFLVTELVEGESLRDRIVRSAPFPPAEVARIGAFIAEGIEVAHQHGVIHRDIKPHNVMVTPSGELRLLDFGIARDVTPGAQSITEAGTLIGTPGYMSPEQFQGEKVDARSDIYSLGVLLYQMATGDLPFRADTTISLGMKHVCELPRPPRSIRPEVPPWLNRIILKCLEKQKEDRYATAGDLASDLNRADVRASRHLRRLRSGDYLIEEDGSNEWDLIIASRTEKDWSEGMTLSLKETLYRLEMRELDETLPAPWVYRFRFWQEAEVIRRLVVYDPDNRPEPDQPRSRLRKWLSRD